MPFATTTAGLEIFYKDWGPKGAQPTMFHHGWPLGAGDWDAQILPAGHSIGGGEAGNAQR